MLWPVLWPLLLPQPVCGVGLRWRHSVSYANDDAGSLFGFSLAAYVDQRQPYAIVGAPLDVVDDWDEGDNRLGRVHRCWLGRGGTIGCQAVPAAKRATHRQRYRSFGHPQPNSRRRQWMGAAVSATSVGQSGYFAACAPRLVVKSRRPRQWRAAGECLLYPGARHRYTVVSPCNDTDRADVGQCLAGFGASVAGYREAGGDYVLLLAAGMPTSYDGSGDLFVARFNNKQPAGNWTLRRESDIAQLLSSQNRSHYLGYSLQLAALLADRPQQLWLVASSPTSAVADWRGVVAVMNVFMTRQLLIVDRLGAIGDYFGHSLAVADFNGDGVGDIAVGAPLYSNSSRGRYDAGRVYIFYGLYSPAGRYGVSEPPAVLEADWPAGRFGHAVAAIGDLDDDGLQELGVGCPYCGRLGRGEVHVYLSSRNGSLRASPHQVLTPPPDSALRQFGWSLAGGVDFDSNGYTDVLVGASSSAAIVLFKSRPVVRLEVDRQQLRAPAAVDARNCGSGELLMRNCQLRIVGQLRLVGRLNRTARLHLRVTLDFDSLVEELAKKRVRAVSNNRRVLDESFKLQVNSSHSFGHTLMVEPSPEDIVTPIVVRMTLEPQWSQDDLGDPVLHPDSDTSVAFPAVQVLKEECGTDNVCEPDLRLLLTDEGGRSGEVAGVVFYRNATEPRRLRLVLENRGEMAVGAVLRVAMPTSVIVQRPLHAADGVSTKDCSEAQSDGRRILSCPLGDLTGGPQLAVSVSLLLLNFINSGGVEFSVAASLHSRSPEPPALAADNEATLQFRVYFKAELLLSGSADQDVVIDTRTEAAAPQESQWYRPQSLGPRFRHSYELFNKGPSPLVDTRVNISLPLRAASGHLVVYLLQKVVAASPADEPLILAPRVLDARTNETRGSCSFSARQPKLNFLQQAADKRRRRRSTTSSSGGGGGGEATRASVLSDVLSGRAGGAARELLACGVASHTFGGFLCGHVACIVPDLPAGGRVRVVLDGLVWAATMLERRAASVQLRSFAVAGGGRRPPGLPLAPSTNSSVPGRVVSASVGQHFLFQGVEPLPVYRMPLWLILLSVLLGLLVLTLIMLCLWRCGFFHREHWESEKPPPAHL